MTRRSTSHRQILSMSLVFLLTGLVGCSHGSEGEEAETPAQETGAAASPEASAPTSPASPASPAQPGAAPSAANAKPATPADTTKMPAVVARVNGVDIKKDELLRQAEEMRARVAQASGGRQVPELDDSFYKEILSSMVAQTLLLQDAARQGVTVTDQEVKTQIEAMMKRFPDAATFQKALSSQGMTEQDLEQNVRREALTQRYLSTKVFNDVKVSDQAAKEFYDKNQEQMQRPERVHVRHILVQVKPDAPAADKQKAKAKAEDLLERAQGGEDFAKLAAENSDDPGSKGRGGDLSWLTRGQTVPPFDQAAFALTKPNELSPVVESQFGYHVIQLLEHGSASTVSFEEAKGRITQVLKQKQAGEKLQARVEQLKKQGKVAVFL
jgi:peptidyl-prolyl cis-trans isomerase C